MLIDLEMKADAFVLATLIAHIRLDDMCSLSSPKMHVGKPSLSLRMKVFKDM